MSKDDLLCLKMTGYLYILQQKVYICVLCFLLIALFCKARTNIFFFIFSVLRCLTEFWACMPHCWITYIVRASFFPPLVHHNWGFSPGLWFLTYCWWPGIHLPVCDSVVGISPLYDEFLEWVVRGQTPGSGVISICARPLCAWKDKRRKEEGLKTFRAEKQVQRLFMICVLYTLLLLHLWCWHLLGAKLQ